MGLKINKHEKIAAKVRDMDKDYYKIIDNNEVLCTLKEDMCNGDFCDECVDDERRTII